MCLCCHRSRRTRNTLVLDKTVHRSHQHRLFLHNLHMSYRAKEVRRQQSAGGYRRFLPWESRMSFLADVKALPRLLLTVKAKTQSTLRVRNIGIRIRIATAMKLGICNNYIGAVKLRR